MDSPGNIIAELRREAGYTQRSLAEALHITDKAVSKWERGISMPDVSLLPKLSLLLDADIELLLGKSGKHGHTDWAGILDLRTCCVDLSAKIYDKPMVYYMLSHYLLLKIREIYIFASDSNVKYLKQNIFEEMGFKFVFNPTDISDRNYMVMNRPCFLFGSDLTRQFQGAMVSESLMKLVPEGAEAPFLFCPAEYSLIYKKNRDYLWSSAATRTLGRGMVCIDMDHDDGCQDVSSFVRMYQKNTGLLIGNIEEIAMRI